jgi:hypothetical protein
MSDLIYITCPRTGAKVSTGNQWPGEPPAHPTRQVVDHCAACGGSHAWSWKDGYREGEQMKGPPSST